MIWITAHYWWIFQNSCHTCWNCWSKGSIFGTFRIVISHLQPTENVIYYLLVPEENIHRFLVFREQSDQLKDNIHYNCIVKVVHNVVVQIPNQLFNDVLFPLAQHDVVKENQSSIYQVFDDFIVNFLLPMFLFPGAQNVEGELFGVICDCNLFRLGEDVRNCHQSNWSVLQRFSFVANYVL